MSEFWVSKKRYFCKYCDTYIADDVPSRQHHENGLRHKGNVDRFVRGLYKAGEKQKKDADEEKREMMRIERAASAAFAGMLVPVERSTPPLQVRRSLVQVLLPAKSPKRNPVEFRITLLQSH